MNETVSEFFYSLLALLLKKVFMSKSIIKLKVNLQYYNMNNIFF